MKLFSTVLSIRSNLPATVRVCICRVQLKLPVVGAEYADGPLKDGAGADILGDRGPLFGKVVGLFREGDRGPLTLENGRGPEKFPPT